MKKVVGLALFSAGLVVGWLLLPMPLWTCGAYASDAAPAWVQAVGSVAAIVAAIYIAERQRRHERRDEFDAMTKRLSVAKRRIGGSLSTLATSALNSAAIWRELNKSDIGRKVGDIEDSVRKAPTLPGDTLRKYEYLFPELD